MTAVVTEYQIVVTQGGGERVELGPQPLSDCEARAKALMEGIGTEDSEIEAVEIQWRIVSYGGWKDSGWDPS